MTNETTMRQRIARPVVWLLDWLVLWVERLRLAEARRLRLRAAKMIAEAERLETENAR